MVHKYFGTDGIRGRVGTWPITPDFMLKLGWAAGCVLATEGRGKVIMGKDTRISGYLFESALQAGLSAAGVDVIVTGPMPTPAIAYLTRTFNGQAGIVISASHNPYYDNGIKFFSGQGTKLADAVERRIEEQFASEITVVESSALGKVSRMQDAAGRYIEYCKASTAPQLNLTGLKLVIDAAHGAVYQVGPAVFQELGAEVITMGATPDGLNINREGGSTQTHCLAKKVRAIGADVGIAFDGDGDRVIMVDEHGHIVDGDELLFIIAMSRQQQGILQGGVVGTLMTNFGIEKALQQQAVPFVRAAVGDRYVSEQLIAKDWYIGGESSGHIICRDITPTGDGIVSALQILKAMQLANKSLSELRQGLRKYPQTLINVRVNVQQDTQQITALPAIAQAIKASKTALADSGRVLLRASGTEPVIRVMVEGETTADTEYHACQLATAVQKALP